MQEQCIGHFGNLSLQEFLFLAKIPKKLLTKMNWLTEISEQYTLWSYYNGNLSFVTYSGVIVKLPSNKG